MSWGARALRSGVVVSRKVPMMQMITMKRVDHHHRHRAPLGDARDPAQEAVDARVAFLREDGHPARHPGGALAQPALLAQDHQGGQEGDAEDEAQPDAGGGHVAELLQHVEVGEPEGGETEDGGDAGQEDGHPHGEHGLVRRPAGLPVYPELLVEAPHHVHQVAQAYPQHQGADERRDHREGQVEPAHEAVDPYWR